MLEGLPLAVVVLSLDAFLHLYGNAEPFSIICSGGGNIQGMFHFL